MYIIHRCGEHRIYNIFNLFGFDQWYDDSLNKIIRQKNMIYDSVTGTHTVPRQDGGLGHCMFLLLLLT